MKKNFREIYNENPETLKNIHEQLCSQMKKGVMEDVNGICEEHCIGFLLDSLELLKKNQESSQQSWYILVIIIRDISCLSFFSVYLSKLGFYSFPHI